ncbi:unnamed protein product, partial [Lymnaea stagnalis]
HSSARTEAVTVDPHPLSTSLENVASWLYEALSTPSPEPSSSSPDFNSSDQTVSISGTHVQLITGGQSKAEESDVLSSISSFVYTTVTTILADDRTSQQSQTDFKTPKPGRDENGFEIKVLTKGAEIYELIQTTTTKDGVALGHDLTHLAGDSTKPPKRLVSHTTKLSYLTRTEDGIYIRSSDTTTPDLITKWPMSSKKPAVYRGPPKIILLSPGKTVALPPNSVTEIVRVPLKGLNGTTMVPGIILHQSEEKHFDQIVRQDNESRSVEEVVYYTGHPLPDGGIPLFRAPKNESSVDGENVLTIHSHPGGDDAPGHKTGPLQIKLTVYKVVKNVLNVSDATAMEAYTRAREMLRKTLEQLAKLWQHCVRGVADVVYVPANQGFVDYSARLQIAYKNIRKAYEYGRTVLRKTYNDASLQLADYFNSLANYFKNSYNFYYDFLEASTRRRKR